MSYTGFDVLKGFTHDSLCHFAASLLLLVGCPTPVEEELTPEEEPIFSTPNRCGHD